MAKIVNKLSGNAAEVIYTERRNWDLKCKLLSSVNKAKRLLDYEPRMKFEDGLVNVHKWFDLNWENVISMRSSKARSFAYPTSTS